MEYDHHQQYLFSLRTMWHIHLPNFFQNTIAASYQAKKCGGCVYKDIVIGKHLTKVKYLTDQNKKRKTMSIYKETRSRKCYVRERAEVFHRDIFKLILVLADLIAAKKMFEKTKSQFVESFFFLLLRYFTFYCFSSC